MFLSGRKVPTSTSTTISLASQKKSITVTSPKDVLVTKLPQVAKEPTAAEKALAAFKAEWAKLPVDAIQAEADRLQAAVSAKSRPPKDILRERDSRSDAVDSQETASLQEGREKRHAAFKAQCARKVEAAAAATVGEWEEEEKGMADATREEEGEEEKNTSRKRKQPSTSVADIDDEVLVQAMKKRMLYHVVQVNVEGNKADAFVVSTELDELTAMRSAVGNTFEAVFPEMSEDWRDYLKAVVDERWYPTENDDLDEIDCEDSFENPMSRAYHRERIRACTVVQLKEVHNALLSVTRDRLGVTEADAYSICGVDKVRIGNTEDAIILLSTLLD